MLQWQWDQKLQVTIGFNGTFRSPEVLFVTIFCTQTRYKAWGWTSKKNWWKHAPLPECMPLCISTAKIIAYQKWNGTKMMHKRASMSFVFLVVGHVSWLIVQSINSSEKGVFDKHLLSVKSFAHRVCFRPKNWHKRVMSLERCFSALSRCTCKPSLSKTTPDGRTCISRHKAPP